MPESDLYPPVRDWLQQQGYTVYVEIFDADVVGLKGDEICVVELKTCNAGELMSQLAQRSIWADYVLAAIPTNTKTTSGYRYHGYGLLQVQGDKVRVRVKPKPQPWYRHKTRKYRLNRLANVMPAREGDLGGLPACPEKGRQRRERDAEWAARKRRKDTPDAE